MISNTELDHVVTGTEKSHTLFSAKVSYVYDTHMSLIHIFPWKPGKASCIF